MQFIISQNKQFIKLGPIDWKQRFIQHYFDDLNIAFTVPATEQGYIKVSNEYEIFPVTNTVMPNYDPEYEQLVGPFYTYANNAATATYTKTDIPLEAVKNKMKQAAADERFKRENAGTTTTVQGKTVELYTNRQDRNMYVQKYSFMADGTTASWKFNSGWLDITKVELASMIATGASYIQDQYDWERTTVASIDAATTAAELKLIEIVPANTLLGTVGV